MCTSRKEYFWREKTIFWMHDSKQCKYTGEQVKGENERENRKYIRTYTMNQIYAFILFCIKKIYYAFVYAKRKGSKKHSMWTLYEGRSSDRVDITRRKEEGAGDWN